MGNLSQELGVTLARPTVLVRDSNFHSHRCCCLSSVEGPFQLYIWWTSPERALNLAVLCPSFVSLSMAPSIMEVDNDTLKDDYPQ